MSSATFATPPRAPAASAWQDQLSPINKIIGNSQYRDAYKKTHGDAKMGADGKMKQRSHILSNEVANAALERSGEDFTNGELVSMRFSLDDTDNFHTKQASSNRPLDVKPNPMNDRALDKEIMERSLSGEKLTVAAAERAKRQIAIFLNSGGDMPDKAIKALRTMFTGLRGPDGNKLVRSNASINYELSKENAAHLRDRKKREQKVVKKREQKESEAAKQAAEKATEQKAKEQKAKEQKAKEQKAKEQKAKEQKAKEQKAKEQNLRNE
jgi:hypothetical protein